jgi:bilirubin oxidase
MPTLDPTTIPKYIDPLVIPPAMPQTDTLRDGRARIDYYEIAVRQFEQQILPAQDELGQPTGFGPTTAWSYGSVQYPQTFNYPAFTIEARAQRPIRVKWINDLVDASGNYLPHLLPVDQTLHWANPPGGLEGRDTHGHTAEPYLGPVPIITHVHGAVVGEESDGYPEAWYLPNAANIPPGYATTGTLYDVYKTEWPLGSQWEPGTAVFQYPNDQEAATLWYHDHTLGMTRLNVYAGPAGFWIVRGGMYDLPAGVLPGPAPQLGDPPGRRYYEIPIAIQDRTFYADSQLFFPDNRAYFEGLLPEQLQIPFIPEMACTGMSDVSPIWNPEFFGNTIVVNGKTWPKLEVEQRRYRFRFLNGCNSRFLYLKMVYNPLAPRPAIAALPFWQIGAEGGFLPAPAELDSLLIALAERADVIVDFTNVPVGTEIYLINEGPDDPFGGGQPPADFDAADPETTGQVMKFVVVPRVGNDKSVPPQMLALPVPAPLPDAVRTRKLSLNELDSETVLVDEEDGNIVLDCDDGEPFGPVAALCGIVLNDGTPVPLKWMDEITETPGRGDTEIWEIHNFTMDAHPIHLHLVTFEVVNREDMMTGEVTGPEPWETGRKDTVIAYPDQITRIKATFDIAGLYVWHCHIIDHEDNEMMRPYRVLLGETDVIDLVRVARAMGSFVGDRRYEKAADLVYDGFVDVYDLLTVIQKWPK